MNMANPSSKITLQETSVMGPALAVLDNKLYLGWTGTDTRLNTLLSTDGKNFGGKQTLSETSFQSPALIAFAGKLRLGWTGTDQRLNIAMVDGCGKVTLNETSAVGPAFAVAGNRLILGWTGTNGHLNWNSSSDGATFPAQSKVTSSETSSQAPALLAEPQANVLIYWTGTNAQLNFMVAEGAAVAKSA
jgi:hypothetical protein